MALFSGRLPREPAALQLGPWLSWLFLGQACQSSKSLARMSELACTHESLHETEGRYGLAAASGCFGGRLVAGGGAD